MNGKIIRKRYNCASKGNSSITTITLIAVFSLKDQASEETVEDQEGKERRHAGSNRKLIGFWSNRDKALFRAIHTEPIKQTQATTLDTT